MRLLFVHGWGFDARLWEPVIARLAEREALCFDRGYFGHAAEPVPDADYVAVAHSLGAMRVLAGGLQGCRGLVAINGFDRFTAAPDIPGVAPRVIERMIARFAEASEAVLAEFRDRCGTAAEAGPLAREPLAEDLRLLRDGDCRAAAARFPVPILSIQGALDPILPAEMRARVFASANRVERIEHPDQGHLLPLTDPDYCARHIESFLDRLQ